VGPLSEQFLAILDEELPGSRFDSAERAAAIRRAMLDDDSLPATCSLLDVLNGAWWAWQTLEAQGRQDRLPTITNTTILLCANISAHGGAGT
jgi:hypothetical protein